MDSISTLDDLQQLSLSLLLGSRLGCLPVRRSECIQIPQTREIKAIDYVNGR